MKTKILSRSLSAIAALSLLGAAGMAVAGPFQGTFNIQVIPAFPHASTVDFHYYPSAGVYFSYSTGQYYYPTRQGWVYSPVLPPHFHLYPAERVVVREYDRHHHRHFGDHLKRHRQDSHHDVFGPREREGWERSGPQGRDQDNHRDRRRG